LPPLRATSEGISEAMTESKPPVSKKIGPRRVRTEAVAGQLHEPAPPKGSKTPPANDDRLKADKPPHY
jgi:hypothetical protein